jgi:hypothetical protein
MPPGSGSRVWVAVCVGALALVSIAWMVFASASIGSLQTHPCPLRGEAEVARAGSKRARLGVGARPAEQQDEGAGAASESDAAALSVMEAELGRLEQHAEEVKGLRVPAKELESLRLEAGKVSGLESRAAALEQRAWSAEEALTKAERARAAMAQTAPTPRPGGPPAGYLALAQGKPLARSKAAFSAPQCAGAAGAGVRFDIRKQWAAPVGSARLGAGAFLCAAQCPAREPELERVFGALAVGRTSLRGLLKLCAVGAYGYLVHIRARPPAEEPRAPLVRYHQCTGTKQPPARGEFATSIALIATLAHAVELPEVLFGFDSSDMPVPQVDSPLKYAVAGWIHMVPGVIRYVGVDSSVGPLFPTRPVLKDAGFMAAALADEFVPVPADWNTASEQIFWRGGNTGLPWDADYLYLMPRPALCMKARNLSGFDVAMTTYNGVSKLMEEEGIKDKIRFEVPPMDKLKFALYKYHIHVDGNSASVRTKAALGAR